MSIRDLPGRKSFELVGRPRIELPEGAKSIRYVTVSHHGAGTLGKFPVEVNEDHFDLGEDKNIKIGRGGIIKVSYTSFNGKPVFYYYVTAGMGDTLKIPRITGLNLVQG